MKNISSKFWLLTFGLIVASIAATFLITRSAAQQTQTAPAVDNSYQIGATLYFQTAAENRALAYQAFNLAKMRLDMELKACKKSRKKMPCAIVTDADETILDNSPQQAWGIKNNRAFNSTDWLDWVNRAEAKPIAGSLEFLNYAASKGVKTFYVTNRKATERAGTLENLKKVGFPEVTDETLLVRTDLKNSTKEPRRNSIEKNYRVVLLLGDNLNDFSYIFENKSITDRFAAADSMKNEFGSRFIVFPNSMYGDWENAIYNYERLDDAQKNEARRNALQSY